MSNFSLVFSNIGETNQSHHVLMEYTRIYKKNDITKCIYLNYNTF